jgi:BirA family transcriptional regulator, biotin operon repressor / biotin---[acetyl-CoA-carboxylase] ligase
VSAPPVSDPRPATGPDPGPAGGAAAAPAQRTFAALADGAFHSGEALAEAAGVTRSAVWKSIESLRALGVQIEAVTHRGYRLVHPAAVLDVARILAALGPAPRASLRRLEVDWSLPSTNAALLAREPPPPGSCDVLLVEHQSAGRGRRGRSWLAPLGGGLCLSIGASFDPLPRELASLSLAIGVCARRALAACGARGLQLKWPNDLVTSAGKAGGILIDLRAESGGPAHVVIGIGLNLRLDAEDVAAVSASGTLAVDLASVGVDAADRNAVAGAVIGECLQGLARFPQEGLAPFLTDWREADALRDRPVRVMSGADGSERHGVARGIDPTGALLLELPEGRQVPIVSGEVSVRALPPS